jgi:hypothetical protein
MARMGSQERKDTRRRRGAAAVVALLALGLLGWLLLWPRPDPGSPPGETEVAPPAVELPPHLPVTLKPGFVPDSLRPPPDPPIIEEVVVEKEEVCDGEENLVTIRARAPDERDEPYLQYQVAGQPGPQAVVRYWKGAPPPVAQVVSRAGVVSTAPVPDVRFKECAAPRIVLVSSRTMENTEAGMLFAARVRAGAPAEGAPSDPFEPVLYRWNFGDGETAETREPWVEHSYEWRTQDRLYTTYLVEVEVVSTKGEIERGRHVVEHFNAEYANLAWYGVVVPRWAFTPRFAVLGPDGIARVSVLLWHNQPEPIQLTRIEITREVEGEGEPAAAPRTVAPREIFGSDRLPPKGLEVDLALDVGAEPRGLADHYEVFGQTVDGLPAHVRFSLMRPDPPLDRESAMPVDEVSAARIHRAQEVLGKARVTEEEIWRVEQSGGMDDLPGVNPYAPSRVILPSGEEVPIDLSELRLED